MGGQCPSDALLRFTEWKRYTLNRQTLATSPCICGILMEPTTKRFAFVVAVTAASYQSSELEICRLQAVAGTSKLLAR